MKTSPYITRSKFSGHWNIQVVLGVGQMVELECYRAGRFDWDVQVLSADSDYVNYDPKQNVAHQTYKGQAVPSFHSLRAAVNWVGSL